MLDDLPPVALSVGFDLDMTLVDSAAGILATLAAALAVSPGGQDVVLRREDVWPWIGMPLEPTVAALAPLADPAAVAAEYRARYERIGVPSTRLLPGAAEAVRAVHAAGGRVLVVSAKAEAGVRQVLARVGLDSGELRPDLIVGGLFAEAKGERLRAEGAEVYVGDHPADVRAARVAGAYALAVATGPQPAVALVDAGADAVLAGLEDFGEWLAAFLTGYRRSRVRR